MPAMRGPLSSSANPHVRKEILNDNSIFVNLLSSSANPHVKKGILNDN